MHRGTVGKTNAMSSMSMLSLRAVVVPSVLVAALSGCFAARDMENVCHATERSGAKAIADPTERARHTAKWIDDHVRTARIKKELNLTSMVGDDKLKADVLREIAKESGYRGACPMADELEAAALVRAKTPASASASEPTTPPPGAKGSKVWGSPEAQRAYAEKLRAAKDPIRRASYELTLNGEAVYGRPIPMFLAWTSDASPLAGELGKLGCPKDLATKLRPLEKTATEVLAKCKPHGPAIAARHKVATREASVGLATIALILESAAPADVKNSPVHDALIAALLGPARPFGPVAESP